MALSFKGSYAGAPVSLQFNFLFIVAEPHSAAFSDERGEGRERVLAAEPGAGSAAAGREEPADLDDRERPERSRDDYDEDRNADRCGRCLM